MSMITVLGALFGDDEFDKSAVTFVSGDAKSYLLQEFNGDVIGHPDDERHLSSQHLMPKNTKNKAIERSAILDFGISAARELLVTIGLIKDKKVSALQKNQVLRLIRTS